MSESSRQQEFVEALSSLYALGEVTSPMSTNEPEPFALTLNDYAYAASKTANYPHAGEPGILPLLYLGLGIAGEGGEVADKVKKILRDDDGIITSAKRNAILEEIGDVLWYVARIADELGADLETVAHMNTAKLRSRQQRGVLGGSGDNR